MRNKRIIAILSVALVVLVAGSFALVLANAHAGGVASAASHASNSKLPNPYHCAQADVPGVAAIKPTRPGAIAYTLQDAKDFILAGAKQNPQKPTIIFDQVVFMTSLQACTLMKGVEIGRPLDAMVCYVAYHGVYQSAYLIGHSYAIRAVYDAHTGNILVSSVGDK